MPGAQGAAGTRVGRQGCVHLFQPFPADAPNFPTEMGGPGGKGGIDDALLGHPGGIGGAARAGD